MKVKLADGTEVEVADTDPIAIATRELETGSVLFKKWLTTGLNLKKGSECNPADFTLVNRGQKISTWRVFQGFL